MKKVPVIFQLETCECGTASLAMILAYYGKHVSLDRLRAECNVSARDGVNAANLIKAAQRLGLAAKCYHMGISVVKKVEFPAIIHWNFNHFVVLEGYKNKLFYIKDSTMGGFTVSEEEFGRKFTGVVITFKKTSEFLEEGGVGLSLSRWKGTVSASIRSGWAIGATLILTVLGEIAMPLLIWYLIDSMLQKGIVSYVLLMMVLGVAALKAAVVFAHQQLVAKLELGAGSKMSALFWKHILKLPIEFFTHRSGVDRWAFMNEKVAQTVFSYSLHMLLNGMIIVGYSCVLLIISPNIACGEIILALLVFSMMMLILHTNEDMRKKSARMATNFLNVGKGFVRGIDSIKTDGSEDNLFQSWAGNQADVTNNTQKVYGLEINIHTLTEGGIYAMQIVLLTAGGVALFHENITYGGFAAIFFSIIGLMNCSKELKELPEYIKSTVESLGLIEDAMGTEVDDRYKHETAQMLKSEPENYQENWPESMQVSKLTFGYNPYEPPMIEDFSMELSQGKWIGVVGQSGCGKTTLIKLLLGLLKPWSGEVRLDNVPLESISRKTITRSLALVNQDCYLFADSIWNNLTLWRKDISADLVEAATVDACIYEDILKLKGEFESQLLPWGRNLSGGQRQRLELARALVSNPSLLILDEATNALDSETEGKVLANLRKRGLSCLIVANRLSTVKVCEEILVLNHGRIVERGTHIELMAAGGHYTDIATSLL